MPPPDRLLRPAFGMYRVEWPGDPGVEFHLSHGDWIRLLRRSGFEIEDLVEVRPPEDATTRYPFVTLEWARRWPCEEVWTRKAAGVRYAPGAASDPSASFQVEWLAGRGSVAGLRPRARLRGFRFPVARRSAGHQRYPGAPGRPGHLIHGVREGRPVRPRGPVKPLSLRTNWRDEARISSSVAGGLKLCSVFMFRHIGVLEVVGVPGEGGLAARRRPTTIEVVQGRRRVNPTGEPVARVGTLRQGTVYVRPTDGTEMSDRHVLSLAARRDRVVGAEPVAW